MIQDGTIKVAPLESFTTGHKNSRVLKGHTEKVTCLMGPETPKPYLLSGSADFTVKLWNIEFDFIILF